MCRSEILSHSADGYVVYCCGCGQYQLAFGTFVVTFSAPQLEFFREQLEEAQLLSLDDPFPEQKTIHLQVHAEHIRMALSSNEALLLIQLLDEAAATVSYNQLIQELQG